MKRMHFIAIFIDFYLCNNLFYIKLFSKVHRRRTLPIGSLVHSFNRRKTLTLNIFSNRARFEKL